MIFNELTLSVPAGHFVPSDIPLLAAYAGALALNRGALRALYRKPDLTVLMVWERSPRMITTLATKLRLSPQSRAHRITTARAMNNFQPSGSAADAAWLDQTEGEDDA